MKDNSIKYAVCVFKVGRLDQLGWHRGKSKYPVPNVFAMVIEQPGCDNLGTGFVF